MQTCRKKRCKMDKKNDLEKQFLTLANIYSKEDHDVLKNFVEENGMVPI